jgi:hypothetical protein
MARASRCQNLGSQLAMTDNLGVTTGPTIKIEPDAGRPGRYRWTISEKGRIRDTSLYSFATKREAQADADRFLEKLNATWRTA